MSTWRSDIPPPATRIEWFDWPRIVGRGCVVVAVLFAGVIASGLLRPAERLVVARGRPVTGRITAWVCRMALRVMGLARRTEGRLMQGSGAIVANHASWLDILALNAAGPMVFVSKSEVADWPGIGLLARLTGTLFIRRDRRDVRSQDALVRARLCAGDRLLIFPEGTSTDGRRVLPFKTALFAAFSGVGARPSSNVQPVSVAYEAPDGRDPRFYGWWGDMDLGPHLLAVLAARRQGSIAVVYHPPIDGARHDGRKALARAAEERVRRGVEGILERGQELAHPR